MSFALGWFYWYLWTILFPTECSAVAILFGYWLPDVNAAAWIVLSLVVCTILNSFSVRVYGESEFWFVSITRPSPGESPAVPCLCGWQFAT